MDTNDNLFYELKALNDINSNVSEEARKLYFELMTHKNEVNGKDVLIICQNRMQVTDGLKRISEKHSVDWVNCRVKSGTDIVHFKTLDECKRGLTGYMFRRIIFN